MSSALTLLLRCESIQKTRDFYRSALGFSVTDSAEGTLTAERFKATLIFTSADLWGYAPQCSGTFYFTVPDLDRYYAEVIETLKPSWPLQIMPYGSREFGISDCNGYTLAFRN